MTMKFISKSSNYMIVLRPGIPGNPITGTSSVPGLSVRFKDGVAEVKDQSTIDLMKASSGFANQDFIAVDDNFEDPFAEQRVPSEPGHIIQEIQFGHITGRKVSDGGKVVLPAAVKKMISDAAMELAAPMAQEMAKQMLPDMVKAVLQEMAGQEAQAPESEQNNTTGEEIKSKPKATSKK